MHKQVQALVLREIDYKESSKLLTVLTREGGRLTVLARAARGKHSPLLAATQLLSYASMTLFYHKGRYTLDEAELLDGFPAVRRDILALSMGLYLGDLAAEITGEVADENVFRLLLQALTALARAQKPQILIKAATEWRLMALAGFAPMAGYCEKCGATPPVEPVLAPGQGLVLCSQCRGTDSVCPLGSDALLALRYVLRCPLEKLYAFALPETDLHLLSRAGTLYVQTQTDKTFGTLSYYNRLTQGEL